MADTQEEYESPLKKFDAPVLRGIDAVDGGASAARALFLPGNFAEAMELAKLMASGLMVPPHLRGKAGDCLAILTQAMRWGMDPFAVASKSYFVNDRIAYEAQLVAAVVNTSGILQERLKVDWYGDGDSLRCSARGRIKGEEREHAVEQDLKTIKVRNSPLWQQAPRQQIAYYTQRLWARLYTPEVLLGVYSVDEVQEMVADKPKPITARPTREDFRKVDQAEVDGGELVQATETESEHQPQASEGTTSQRQPETPADGSPPKDDAGPEAASSSPQEESSEDVERSAQLERMVAITDKLRAAKTLREIDQITSINADIIASLDPTLQQTVKAAAEGRRAELQEQING